MEGLGTAAIIHKSTLSMNNSSNSPIQIVEPSNKSKLVTTQVSDNTRKISINSQLASKLSPNRCHSESDLTDLTHVHHTTGYLSILIFYIQSVRVNPDKLGQNFLTDEICIICVSVSQKIIYCNSEKVNREFGPNPE